MSARKSRAEAVVSAMGVLLSFFITLVSDIRELGGEAGADIYRLATEDGRDTVKAIARLIVEAGQRARNCYVVFVDSTKPLAELIQAGHYDRVNSDITAEHFPAKSGGRNEIRIELRHLNCYFKSGDEVIAALAKEMPGYRPARIEELLALGAAQPDLQRQFPIAALGSIWHHDGRHRFACLDGHGAGRRLVGLDCLEGSFSGFWRFAVVREAILP